MGLGARLALVFAGVAAGTALLVGAASYVTTDRQVTTEIDQFLEERAEEIAGGQRAQPSGRKDNQGGRNGNSDSDRSDGSDSGISANTTTDTQVVVAVSPDSEVQILDSSGAVTSNSGLLLPVDDDDLALARDDGRSVLRTVAIGNAEFRMITTHLDGGGAVQVARSLEESISLLGALQTRTLVTAVVVAAVAAGTGWFMAQRTTRPLRALTTAVTNVAETRDFSTSVPSTGSDEVGQLADGFNHLLGTLEQSQAQQRRLVQDAAHELRTPLTSVTANLDWLLRVSPDDPVVVHQTLAGVRREVGELNYLIAEIIELATEPPEAPSLRPVDLAAVAQESAEKFSLRTGRPVTVSAAPAMVSGDGDSLARAVSNLLSNAGKYSPLDGPIALEVSPNGLFVDDAGPGIPASERELIFDRFYRRDEDRSLPGSGLGLAIVADVIAHHGGTVVVEDSTLGGARVGFVIPAL